MPFSTTTAVINQIDAKPYTVWHLTPTGWTIIKPFSDGEYQFKTIQTLQLKEEMKRPLNLISSKMK